MDITGAALDKSLEEADVENVGNSLCRPLYRWFLDHDNETDAAKCNLRVSGWQGLRDNALILKAREIRDLAIPAAALPGALDYGITSALVQQLTDEIDQYELLVNAPATSIAGKKALTLGMRAEFNKVERLYEALDDHMLGFSGTAAGRDLIAAYKEARIIRDAGHGPATPTTTPPPVV